MRAKQSLWGSQDIDNISLKKTKCRAQTNNAQHTDRGEQASKERIKKVTLRQGRK